MQIESEWFTAANGSQWRLTMCSTQEKQHLSVFLEARTTVNHFPQDAHHTISVQILKANGKLEKILNKTSKDTFTSENFMIGYPKSILLSRIAMVNDKSLFVTSTVRASTSKEISKKITGYVGLINEGTTCYMNSLLQTLFMITSFRQAIYKIPFSDSEECRIPKALGKLFAALQTNPKSLSTQDLLKSFGWGRDQWHEQQDVQEFLYKFSDTMEKSMFGTPAEGIYSELFKGSIVQKIKCIEVDYCSESIEEFMDLQLDVKGCGNIYTSLDKYVEPVLLKGEIQYDAMNFGKQDAVKVVKFKKLPSVLQIQLKRFEYNQNRGMMMKVNERFEFYPIIDLNKYTEDMGTKDVFQLFSITVHSGTLGKGHYSSFISPQLDNCWFKFNDEMVDLALPCQAIEANWGGDFEDIGLGEGGRVIPLKKKSDISAYMLVYIRISDSSSVLPQMSSSCIPAQLLITEKPLELIKRDKKRNCKNTFIIALASKETLTGWEGAGVAGWHSKYLFFIRISKTQETIGNYFRNQMQMFTEYKLWTFTPGPSNWNFVEVNLNDPLSTCAFTAEGSRCLFVESTHKVFTGGPENWTWNELETLPESEKHDFSKTFVFIKKFENGNTRILGCEWLRENCYTIEVLKELKENVFKKVFDSRCDAWACIESSKSDSPFVREAYCFRSLEKNWKIFTGDVFIFGEDVVDAPTLLMQTYNKIEIELIFHDKENYSEQKSYSKDLLEKHSFKTQFKISADLSSPLFILMKEIHSSLNLPSISEKSIQVLFPNFEPAKASNFSLSKVMSHFRVHFDIVPFNVLEEGVTHFNVIEFSKTFEFIRSINCETKSNLMTAVKSLSLNNSQVVLFRYQQRAILKLLKGDEDIKALPGGVSIAIYPDKPERTANKIIILGFHGFSIDQGSGKPFFFVVNKNVTCEDLKRKVVQKMACLPDNVKVARVDCENSPSCYKLVGDLDELDENFVKKFPGCGIFIEHKSAGMKFN